ncbi:hypothetical protein Rsub_02138 [Raphidocelis subcapitata]|uniref:Uncharacterized protein n=1 Tax=Raphidocelis subcapitata TaxID=307507 RepID=A0A2V0NNT5_9CHLO|nr:hypothetical protein Rsub_02138 [Raphidocelis subcapitata]|eukprot:GBF89261.1 hypothetical protein Rsub_02138 [Raphidocelis subcapitata]
MAARRAAIKRLNALIADKQGQLRQLEAQNDDLRIRLAGLHLTWRCLQELCAHRAAHGADTGELELQSQRIEAHFAAALAGLAEHSQGSGGSGGGSGGARLCTPPSPTLSGSSGGEAYNAGSEGSGAAAVALEGEISRRLAGSVLAALPHLAPGATLLHLESVTADDVAHFKALSVPAVVARWSNLMREARAISEAIRTVDAQAEALRAQPQAGLSDAQAAAEGQQLDQRRERLSADLYASGLRIKKFYNLITIWNFSVFAEAGASNFETREATGGTRDAPLSHWESVVRSSEVTKNQARITTDVHRSYRARIAALHEERATLSAHLSAAAAEAAAAPPGAEAAAMGFRGEATERQGRVVEALDENINAERSAWLLFALFSVALLSPRQTARLWSSAFPWPMHTPLCCRILEHDLRFNSEGFAAASD